LTHLIHNKNIMRAIRTTIIAASLLLTLSATAQDCIFERNVHEVGVIMGATYYMGNFNPNRTPFFYPSGYGGVMYRYGFSRYFALRGQVGYGHIRGSGANVKGLPIDESGNNWRFNRPWAFADILAEFNFMPYNAVNLSKKQRFTPVVLLGFGGSYLSRNAGSEYNDYSYHGLSYFLNVPVGIGIKWCFIKRVTLGVDWIWRLSLYDQIDYYSTTSDRHGNPVSHSNPINNDWIGTVGITLSYIIKEKLPCPAIQDHKFVRPKLKGIRHDPDEKQKKQKKRTGIRTEDGEAPPKQKKSKVTPKKN